MLVLLTALALAQEPYVLKGGAYNRDLAEDVVVDRVRAWAVQELYDVQDPVTMSLSDREFISRVVIPFVPSSLVGAGGVSGSLSCMVRVTVERTGAGVQLGPCQHQPDIAIAGSMFGVPLLNQFGLVTEDGYPIESACRNMASKMKQCRSKWHRARMADMQQRIADRWSTVLPSLRAALGISG